MNERIISGTLTGTTAMTLFSYIISGAAKRNFKEPELLGKLMHRLVPQTNKTASELAAWQVHYAVGLAFVLAYSSLWKQSKPSWKNGLLLGGISGIIAILVWKLAFKIHPAPPRIKFKEYYLQLVAAHLIFGIFSTVGYNAISPAVLTMAAVPKLPEHDV